MSKRRVKGKATLQKERILIVRPATEPVLQHCPRCEARVPMVIPEEAARRWGVSPRVIYRWMDAGRLHFVEYPHGDVLVCLNSMESTLEVDHVCKKILD